MAVAVNLHTRSAISLIRNRQYLHPECANVCFYGSFYVTTYTFSFAPSMQVFGLYQTCASSHTFDGSYLELRFRRGTSRRKLVLPMEARTVYTFGVESLFVH
uniref:WGS project CBMI000000000 data, contig CS3069_c003467 n=1 Tax=Fusarium clavum TaxID=2594811 RepID=A0A090N5X2_9HYPO|nr:unnamed protein product [Fusarium clavum]